MNTLRLSLPLPPSVNNQYVTVGRRRVLSGPAKTFRRSVRSIVRSHFDTGAIEDSWLEKLRGCPIACDLTYFFETPYKRDLDGGLKITLDALCDALDLDDRYLVSITLAKRIDPLNPRTELELGAIDEWEFDERYVLLEARSAPDSDCDRTSGDDRRSRDS